MELNLDQLRTLRHMLGIDDPSVKEPKSHRDYYCATPNDPELHELERIGAVTCYANRGGYEWFTTTDAGRKAAFASHKTIRDSKGRRMYLKFRDLRDCWPDFTFRDFLTDPELRDIRRAV